MDADGNGTLDILTTAADTRAQSVQWFSGRGDGSFESGQDLTWPDGQPLIQQGAVLGAWIADWDGDGLADLITGGRDILLYSGVPGGFGAPVALALAYSPSVMDWDGDGDLDLLTSAREAGVRLHENTGSRREPRLASPRVLISRQFGFGNDYVVTDWNGDGLMDLLLPTTYIDQLAGTPDPLSAEELARLESARAELDRIDDQILATVRERPRALTRDVFAERQARREALWRQADVPLAIVQRLEAKRDAAEPSSVTRSVLELHLGR